MNINTIFKGRSERIRDFSSWISVRICFQVWFRWVWGRFRRWGSDWIWAWTLWPVNSSWIL